jgi:hypothetical protein
MARTCALRSSHRPLDSRLHVKRETNPKDQVPPERRQRPVRMQCKPPRGHERIPTYRNGGPIRAAYGRAQQCYGLQPAGAPRPVSNPAEGTCRRFLHSRPRMTQRWSMSYSRLGSRLGAHDRVTTT